MLLHLIFFFSCHHFKHFFFLHFFSNFIACTFFHRSTVVSLFDVEKMFVSRTICWCFLHWIQFRFLVSGFLLILLLNDVQFMNFIYDSCLLNTPLTCTSSFGLFHLFFFFFLMMISHYGRVVLGSRIVVFFMIKRCQGSYVYAPIEGQITLICQVIRRIKKFELRIFYSNLLLKIHTFDLFISWHAGFMRKMCV